jgi:hypothetical protein
MGAAQTARSRELDDHERISGEPHNLKLASIERHIQHGHATEHKRDERADGERHADVFLLRNCVSWCEDRQFHTDLLGDR